MITASLPLVYGAGPIDYVEHLTPDNHLRENWRHRVFDALPIDMFCPTCANAEQGKAIGDIMRTNADALRAASFFVGYFPGVAATFGTPIEVWQWCERIFVMNKKDAAVLVHPAATGIFVRYLEAEYDLAVVQSFEGAREWLTRRL